MAVLDIPVSDKLLEVIKKLAIKLYGDDSEVSRKRVVETALSIRIVWSHLIDRGQQETGEVVSKWDFSELQITGKDTVTINDWLFRR